METEDATHFDGPLWYFGVEESEIMERHQRSVAFLLRLLSEIDAGGRRMYANKPVWNCKDGEATGYGRDERVWLSRIDPAIRGSNYEGWSDRVCPGGYTREAIEDTIGYTTIWHPAGVAILSGVTQEEEGILRCEAPRVHLVDEEWITRRVENLLLVVMVAFDYTGLISWVPEKRLSRELVEIAGRFGVECICAEGGIGSSRSGFAKGFEPA